MAADGRSQPARDADRNRILLNVTMVTRKNIVASPHVTTKRRGIIWRWLNRIVSGCFTKGYTIKGYSLVLMYSFVF